MCTYRAPGRRAHDLGDAHHTGSSTMKKKQPTPATAPKRLELGREQIADLEVTDRDSDAIRGGGRGQPVSA